MFGSLQFAVCCSPLVLAPAASYFYNTTLGNTHSLTFDIEKTKTFRNDENFVRILRLEY